MAGQLDDIRAAVGRETAAARHVDRPRRLAPGAERGY